MYLDKSNDLDALRFGFICKNLPGYENVVTCHSLFFIVLLGFFKNKHVFIQKYTCLCLRKGKRGYKALL